MPSLVCGRHLAARLPRRRQAGQCKPTRRPQSGHTGGNSSVTPESATVKSEVCMEFRILGSLEVVDEGRPISIRRGKEQALLAYLLLHANEVVPSGRLIDALWGERPPPTAPKILQNAVSHLRKELGAGRLVTSGSGYVLRVGEDELDLHRFERL